MFSEEKKALKKITARLKKALGHELISVTAFGSMVRGDFNEGAKTTFSLHFIKPGILSAEMLKIFNQLLLLRKDKLNYDSLSKHKS
ncbi:hypothetical protein [Thermodesulfovibrio sp. 3462-1]|uniref:Polymerase nucleotidyl transferase domain-containing protein n=1 Tax=Thermodesulfovibrio obliviosus TaxID=3118332 RepID=A0AAU8H1S7_9BACT